MSGRERSRRRRLQRERNPRIDQWITVGLVLLAPVGPLVFLVWDTDLVWWLAPFTTMPLLLWLGHRRGDDRSGMAKSMGDEPLLPPD